MRILIADGQIGFRAFLCRMLQSQKDLTVVDEATDSEDAVRKTLKHRPELVLMDMELPGADGLETTRQIKRTLPRTKVIMFSNLEGAAYREATARCGADDFLLKLAPLSKMLASMRDCVGLPEPHAA